MINALRHTSIYDPAQFKDKRVALIGVGTIGSHLALTIARMQIPITMYDHDTIEEHNLATQAYTRLDLNSYKVDAVQAEAIKIGAEPENVEAIREKFTPEIIGQYQGIALIDRYTLIVSCVDSITARREIAEQLRDTNLPVIDGRVGAEQVEVYRYPNAGAWLAALPESADNDPCGARFTAYTANICAGLLANNIKRELLGQSVPPCILYNAVSSTFLKP